jgi:hypothetical protein
MQLLLDASLKQQKDMFEYEKEHIIRRYEGLLKKEKLFMQTLDTKYVGMMQTQMRQLTHKYEKLSYE